MSKKKEVILLVIAFLGAMLGCYVVVCFNLYVMPSLPLAARMVCMILTYWLIALIPVIVMLLCKDKLTDYGFCREGIGRQILVGILAGLGMSVVFTLIPHIAGFGAYVDNGTRYRFWWQFLFEFVYFIVSVGAVEEFVFRGILYEKIRRIADSDLAAIIVSSVLFGVFHIFGGNVIQVILTAGLGMIFCLLRSKIKGCSTLSLILAHGVYDAMISVWLAVFAV
ncbi:MAG: CPBP family intramembrane metalloprotease [Lachnospiraceae bacterium]|nr:CPBP family intramembrane metalloprotease [Lachnospiraceae bacterium]